MSLLPGPQHGLPFVRLVLAISLDGRLAPPEGGAAQIGGRGDRRVLEEALAWSDGALLGAETLRRHGSTCLIHAPDLLERRIQRGLAPQPLALVASRSGRLPAGLPFFAQPVQRWLLLQRTPGHGAQASEPLAPLSAQSAAADTGAPGPRCSAETSAEQQGLEDKEALHAPAPPFGAASSPARTVKPPPGFARVLPMGGWEPALRQLAAAGLQRLVVLGGAALTASLLAENRIDELQLTLCPRLLGGQHTWLAATIPLPLSAGTGWRLLEQRPLEGEELLLRYGRSPLPSDAGSL
jgi:5-amino-6-(5-phosphoribosylamino)uracil reductase